MNLLCVKEFKKGCFECVSDQGFDKFVAFQNCKGVAGELSVGFAFQGRVLSNDSNWRHMQQWKVIHGQKRDFNKYWFGYMNQKNTFLNQQ